jgi:hypothetical protein
LPAAKLIGAVPFVTRSTYGDRKRRTWPGWRYRGKERLVDFLDEDAPAVAIVG